MAVALLLALALPAIAVAAFPGSDFNESVRQNTPNDPDFDPCESDNEGGAKCSNVFDEQYFQFGFAPGATQLTATYKNPGETARQQAQNSAAGRNPLGQIPGVSADRAWKLSTGSPEVDVAILDTGIRWERASLRRKIRLNAAELPRPKRGASACASDDCNGDGAFDIDDFAQDTRVNKAAGEAPADSVLDASDLLRTFGDRKDSDRNGFTDDIAGWDFFDDDNNPFDASSYSSASNHGTGRAEEAAEETNEGAAGAGMCPRCRVVPMRVWDTFVVDTNNFAQAVLYAADNEIEVVEGAVGALFNSRFARETFDYAYRKGVFMAIVSSDLNTADHNIPTLYDEALQVQGTVSDVHGLGGSPPGEVGGFLSTAGIPSGAPVATWARNSGTTQYGGHAHIVMPAVTGSQATGQAAGAAGLIASYARQRGTRLAPNEIKQLITLTAEDVVPENTVGTGVPDPSQPGWDQHFGYGKPDLGLALERVRDGRIPPQALITSPEWFAPLEVGDTKSVGIGARLSSRTGGYSWKLQWAPGLEPLEADFRDAATGNESAPREGRFGTLDLNAVRAALDARPGGGATSDPTAPSKGPGDPDPNEPAFTVRMVVTDANGNRGEDRKMLFAYRDPTLHDGYLREITTGGEASQRLFDLNGDNRLDIVQADSSGQLNVLNHDGTPLKSFNKGRPVSTGVYSNAHLGAPAYKSVRRPREVLRTPAIGDIDGDMEPEIVDSAGEHVYAWNADGSRVRGFPVRVNPAYSEIADRTKTNHVKRGFIASPTLGDLTGDKLPDIAIAGLDQHLYAWNGKGKSLPGFPVKLKAPGERLDGAESINTPAFGDVDGDGKGDLVVPTAEVAKTTSPGAPSGVSDLLGGFRGLAINVLSNAIGGSGRVYAISGTGKFLKGWPIKPNGALPDALPLVLPGVDHVLGDVNGDKKADVVGYVSTGDMQSHGGDGKNITTYDSSPATGEHVDKSKILNLVENPIVAEFDGRPGLEVIKGGITLNQLVNLGVAVGQNLPYNHVMQAWDAATGTSLPAFPQAVEDFQLLSAPSVADISDAPGKELVFGTGLYYLRGIASDGSEGSGWPKFTGGWLFAQPAVGDTDGDGKLEVTALTREGYAFQWDTDRPVCGTNDEWWTSRHDEWNTGAYGTDTRPPGTARSFSARRLSATRRQVSFIAPGDDWLCGKAKGFRILASDQPIVHPRDGRRLADFSAREAAGQRVTHTVFPRASDRYFAVIYQDEAGNWGHVAPVRTAQAAALRLAVSPARVGTGSRCFRFRATSSGRGTRATVNFAGTRRQTSASGRVTICKTFRTTGSRRATASRSGFRSAATSVRVVAGSRFTG